jgi:hypothetical protein
MTKALSIKIIEAQRTLFWILVVSVVGFIFSYGYLTAQSIIDVAERKNVERQIAELRSEAIILELSYLEKANSITLDLALEKGFVKPQRSRFVSRTNPIASLSLNE